jgi:hypothetical protein
MTVYEPVADRRTNDELLVALEHWCTCDYNVAGARTTQCPGHAALVQDDSWVKRLLFVRYIAPMLVAEEFGA